MAIDAISSPALTAANTAATKASNPLSDSDPKVAQDKFLKLLVTQLKNQDPLQPLDNAQVTSQVAQLNTVTGIQDLNAAVNNINMAMGASQVIQSTALLGKKVLSEGNGLSFEGKPVSFGVDLALGADNVNIDIKDSLGRVVSTQNLGRLPAGLQTIEWDGETTDGSMAPSGSYTFSVQATAGDKKVTSTAYQEYIVRSLENLGAEGIRISTQSGKSLGLSDVKRVF